jgi:hypothetical protein
MWRHGMMTRATFCGLIGGCGSIWVHLVQGLVVAALVAFWMLDLDAYTLMNF